MNSSKSLWLPAVAALVLLAGCDSIGEGNTIVKLDILPASTVTQLKSFEIGDTYKAYQCLRDELIVRATFTDGSTVNFSNRVEWTSSDPAVVAVSNNDILATFLAGNPAADGTFYEHESLTYGRGTIVPHGTPGQSATISVRYSKLSASLDVEIRKPTLRIVTAPHPDLANAAPPYAFAVGTTERLTLVLDAGGRTVEIADVTGGTQNSININPIRWTFTGGTFVPQDDAVDGDVDMWVIDTGPDRIAAMRLGGTDAFVQGKTADFLPHEVSAELSLCEASPDVALRPLADIQVATFYDDPGTAEDDRLILSREAGFHTAGFLDTDIVTGTNTQVQVRGQIDANGDGSLITEQFMNFAGYIVAPLNATCEDDATQLGCGANASFTVTSGGLVAAPAAVEGATARLQACTPGCLFPKATLEADATTVNTGVTVNFTATAVDPPSGVAVQYTFDFGDGTTQGPQAGNTASHAYASAGQYTATARLVDAAFPTEFLSRNAGAVRILAGVAPTPGNTAPTAVLEIDSFGGEAPYSVIMSGAESDDSNSGDEVVVYEFDPGDGTPVVRQTSSTFVHTYMNEAGSPFTPTLTVYDENGVASAADTAEDDADTTDVNESEVAITGVAPVFVRSNVLDLRARKATLCSAEILPGPVSTPTVEAFTYPGPRFSVLGSFVADTDTDTCADPVIGTQDITRFWTWNVRPEGVEDETTDVVAIRFAGGDFQSPGQLLFFNDVAAPTTFDVTVSPQAPFVADEDDGEVQVEPTPTTLTVTPCTTCTP
jgi:hypothetical protein